MKTGIIILSFCLVLIENSGFVSTVYAKEVYKWTDDAGAEKVEVSKIQTYSSPPIMEPIESVEYNSDAPTVELYSAQWCGICRQAKHYMTEHDIAYSEYDVEHSTYGKRRFKALGGKGVPLIVVGQRKMHGFNADYLQLLLAKPDS
ncbi:MAG: glutaredoxin domain-containing protein [Pseudomonadota bacterium]|nr:glutaredoxin domain-containing protein [Pseudomonadota bacterium]